MLHVTAKDRTQQVKVVKQKDGQSGQVVSLTMAQVRIGEAPLDPMADDRPTTLVLREAGLDPFDRGEDATTRDRVVGELFGARALDPLTVAQIVAATQATRSLVYRTLTALVEEGVVEKHNKTGRASTYSLQRSAWPKEVR